MNIEINKLKLQKKLGTTQTGGKGTSRRTIKQVYKRTGKNKNTKIVSGLKNTIKEINKKILQLNDKNYITCHFLE